VRTVLSVCTVGYWWCELCCGCELGYWWCAVGVHCGLLVVCCGCTLWVIGGVLWV